MKRRRLRKYVVPTISAFLIGTILFSSYKMYEILSYNVKVEEKYEIQTEDNRPSNIENIIPTMNESKTIIRPYTNTNVSLTIPFYEIDQTDDAQANALIYYEGIYMQNTGALYTLNEIFDVVSVLDGIVKDIKEDSIMGNIIEIEHSKNLTTVYQSLGEVKVTIGSSVSQGTVIASSGSNTLTTDSSNALHFEVFYKGELINPENFYLLEYDEVMQQ